jgi:hypothetical protein
VGIEEILTPVAQGAGGARQDLEESDLAGHPDGIGRELGLDLDLGQREAVVEAELARDGQERVGVASQRVDGRAGIAQENVAEDRLPALLISPDLRSPASGNGLHREGQPHSRDDEG